MIIGTDKERKADDQGRIVEWRVGVTPSAVKTLVDLGHTYLVETGAGQHAGFPDHEYAAAGAEIVGSQSDVYERCDMVYKVKEPQRHEWAMFRRRQILFAYIHSANRYEMLTALLEHKVVAIAFEDVATPGGRLPLLEPMSVIAGHVAQQKAYMYLLCDQGGPGMISGYLQGATPAKVCITGTGFAGEAAIRIAWGAGSRVVALFNSNVERAQRIEHTYRGVTCLRSTPDNVKCALEGAHILNNCMTWPISLRDRVLISTKMLDLMDDRGIVMDVSSELQGGLETTRGIHTSHAEPTRVLGGKLHYVVPNIPAILARSASEALSVATLPWAIRIASGWNWRQAEPDDPLYIGMTCAEGRVINAVVKEWYDCVTRTP